jgi:hypothetical protein
MRPHRFLVLVLAAPLLAGGASSAWAQAARGPKPHHVSVEVDISRAPEAADWAKKAKDVIQEWYPRVARLLESDGDTPPTKIKLVLKNDMGMKVPGVTSGNTISISSEYILKHPHDLGMAVHEMTHVIQGYPHSPIKRGWLTEGICDYIRFYHYEPGPSIGKFRPEKAHYTDSYRTAARFLAWIEKTHDKTIIKTLNTACRHAKYNPDIFKHETSRTLDELWDEFIADAKDKQAEKKPKGDA